jgi:hypothetical protein
MKSSRRGKSISKAEVTNISEHGFWVFLSGKEYFLPFDKFPWFKDSSISQITDLQVLHGTHIYWPKLDVDLSLNIIEQPDKYNLIAR